MYYICAHSFKLSIRHNAISKHLCIRLITHRNKLFVGLQNYYLHTFLISMQIVKCLFSYVTKAFTECKCICAHRFLALCNVQTYLCARVFSTLQCADPFVRRGFQYSAMCKPICAQGFLLFCIVQTCLCAQFQLTLYKHYTLAINKTNATQKYQQS